jgi:hypothetical protein
VLPNFRRCAQCGAWLRPWSTGGKPSTWNRYTVGGAGRPEGWGEQLGGPTDAAGSVWVRYGPNGEYVRQSTPAGQEAPSRRQRERKARPPRQPRRSKAQAPGEPTA